MLFIVIVTVFLFWKFIWDAGSGKYFGKSVHWIRFFVRNFPPTNQKTWGKNCFYVYCTSIFLRILGDNLLHELVFVIQYSNHLYRYMSDSSASSPDVRDFCNILSSQLFDQKQKEINQYFSCNININPNEILYCY